MESIAHTVVSIALILPSTRQGSSLTPLWDAAAGDQTHNLLYSKWTSTFYHSNIVEVQKQQLTLNIALANEQIQYDRLLFV